jgi:hypothetical protein
MIFDFRFSIFDLIRNMGGTPMPRWPAVPGGTGVPPVGLRPHAKTSWHSLRFPLSALRFLPSALGLLIATLCLLPPSAARAAWFRREPPRPGRTTLGSPLVSLPAQLIGNFLVVTVKWDRHGPYNFVIDTGANVTLVSPAIAERYGTTPAPTDNVGREVAVKSADGETTVLRVTSLKRIELGDARFEAVPARIYDCTAISLHLGLRIDGFLGFPLFRETLLTLDYPHLRVLLTSPKSASALQPGSTLPFNNESKTPFIPLRVGDRTFLALIDSGSDATLNLNPLGLDVTFVQPPRPGAIRATLTGDQPETVGRLAQTILLGDYPLTQPVVNVIDEFTSIGGGVLKYFVLTFDQERSQVTFYREKRDQIVFPPRRSSGMSFAKAGAYWRVVGVVPGSDAAKAGREEGDLITRIDDEPVERWSQQRYEALVAQADEIAFTFFEGQRPFVLKLKVMDLVP